MFSSKPDIFLSHWYSFNPFIFFKAVYILLSRLYSFKPLIFFYDVDILLRCWYYFKPLISFYAVDIVKGWQCPCLVLLLGRKLSNARHRVALTLSNNFGFMKSELSWYFLCYIPEVDQQNDGCCCVSAKKNLGLKLIILFGHLPSLILTICLPQYHFNLRQTV